MAQSLVQDVKWNLELEANVLFRSQCSLDQQGHSKTERSRTVSGAPSHGNTPSSGRVDAHCCGGGQTRTLELTLHFQRVLEGGRGWKHSASRGHQALLCWWFTSLHLNTQKEGLHNHTIIWATGYPMKRVYNFTKRWSHHSFVQILNMFYINMSLFL